MLRQNRYHKVYKEKAVAFLVAFLVSSTFLCSFERSERQQMYLRFVHFILWVHIYTKTFPTCSKLTTLLIQVLNINMRVSFYPIWTGLVANLKRPETFLLPPPNLAISSQMTMKLGKDILWVGIFTNRQICLMTLSSC